MDISDINIGSTWEDTLGKCVWKNDKIVQLCAKCIVTIISKTSNSIEYKDDGGFHSWIHIDYFLKFEKSVNKIRFIKIS
jgi:hypothetical protein